MQIRCNGLRSGCVGGRGSFFFVFLVPTAAYLFLWLGRSMTHTMEAGNGERLLDCKVAGYLAKRDFRIAIGVRIAL